MNQAALKARPGSARATDACPKATSLAGLKLCAPYAVAIILFAFIYNLTYAFSYYPLTEGWFSEYARLLREGQIPHRDFHLLLSPFYSMIIASIQAVFGESFLALRIFGLFATAGIGLALFSILRPLLGFVAAACATVPALIYYQSGNTYVGYDFTQFVTLFMLLGASLTISATAAAAEGADAHTRLAAGGVLFGLAVLTKHSNAGIAAVVLAVPAFVVGLRARGLRPAIQSAAIWAIGFLAPIALLLLWLGLHGALQGFFADLFIDAPAAKGGAGSILGAWARGFFSPIDSYRFWSLQAGRLVGMVLAASAVLIVIVMVIHAVHARLQGRPARTALGSVLDRPAPTGVAWAFGLAIVAALTIADVYSRWGFVEQLGGDTVFTAARSVLIVGAVNACIAGFAITAVIALARPNPALVRWTLTFAFGMALVLGNGTSAGLSEISAFFGYALILGTLFRLTLPWGVAVLPVAAVALAISSGWMQLRYEQPYAWWGVSVGDARDQACARLPGIFEGLCLRPDQARTISKISALIEAHSAPGEAILVYPHLPVFYLTTGRAPFGGAVVSWFDFMSDRQAIALASKVASAPPRVLVVADLPGDVAGTHERLFRGGRPSGQRQLVAAIQRLEENGSHCPVGGDEVDGMTITVIVLCKPAPKLAALAGH